MSHTPGPWLADEKEHCGSDGKWGVWHIESGGPICWVGDPYPRGDNHPYENMVLIAAAPLLLEAAEKMANYGGQLERLMERLEPGENKPRTFVEFSTDLAALRTAINAARGNQ